MKKTILYLLISTFLFACSNEDDQDDQTGESIPVSATALTATLTANAHVSLAWKDNANNETGFKIERQTGNGPFEQVTIVSSNITGYTDSTVVVNTIYVYRVVAYNGAGASYSNLAKIGVYHQVQIGGKIWLQQNLDVDHYRNGDIIPQVTNSKIWDTLTTGAWCYYLNNTANGPVYGKLYNWYAVNDSRGLAPEGWHVATSAEWVALTDELGGTTLAGGPMKSTEHWTAPNTGATNSSGFSAVGGGARIAQGAFNNLGIWGAWWTADNDTEGISFYRILYNDNTKSEGYHIYNQYGMSVRCVKN